MTHDTTKPIARDGDDDEERVLIVYSPDAAPKRIALRDTLTIGRATTCDIVVNDDSVSRRHAAFHRRPTVTVEDLGGTNGVFISGQRIEPAARVPLAAQAIVEIGHTFVRLSDGTAADTRPAASPAFDGYGEPMQRLERLLAIVAGGDVSVILTGETGVGKDVHAEKLHRMSPRADKPFVAVNCAALAEHLVESELFGHERGAFTGAHQAKVGLLEAAQGGTVFLDEIGELPLSLQAKLLRALEKKEVVPVGATKPRRFEARFVSATHRDLEAAVHDGTFRMDLFFRLNGIMVEIPPLRERREEIPELASLFAEEAARRMNKSVPTLSPQATARLLEHPFPGNVRELKNIVERAVLLCQTGTIDVADFHFFSRSSGSLLAEAPQPSTPTMASTMPMPPRPANMPTPSTAPLPLPPPSQSNDDDEAPLSQDLRAYERKRIEDALTRSLGNQTRAAELLGVTRRTLIYRMGLCGIDGDAFRKRVFPK